METVGFRAVSSGSSSDVRRICDRPGYTESAFTLYPTNFVAEISDRMYRAGLWIDSSSQPK
jgi:hypothetical protein